MLLFALWLAAADGGLPLRMEFEGPAAEVRLLEVQSGHWHLGIAASAQARVSLAFGAADRGDVLVSGNTLIIDHRVEYGDLFDPGFGVTLEADLLFRPPDRRGNSREPAMGIYVALEYDWFGGDSARAQPATTIRPDTMKIASVLVGFKAEGAIEGPLYGDLRAGVGAVHYPSVDADFLPTAAAAGRGELFADTVTFAMEVRLHFGWRAGPLAAFFGFGTRFLAPPDRGANSTLDPGPMFLLDFEVGAEIGF